MEVDTQAVDHAESIIALTAFSGTYYLPHLQKQPMRKGDERMREE